MRQGILIFGLIVLFVVGGLVAFWRNSKTELPKNLPPPLKDEDEDDER